MTFIKGYKQSLEQRTRIGLANKGKYLNSSNGKIVAKNGQKICPRCRQWKSLDQFDKRPERPIGVRTYCKPCFLVIRQKNPISYRLTNYKAGAKSRGIEWKITKEQFESFWNKPCYYCASIVETIGLDRIDSDKCYEITNVVACCHTCNVMKLAIPRDLFIEHCRKIVLTQIRKEIY